MLRSDYVQSQEAAAAALRSLATRNADNKVTIGRAGGHREPLVALLHSGSARAQFQAVDALRNLVADANQVAIARAGAIEPRVALVRSSSDGARARAAGMLRNLAANPDNQVRIVRAGAIEPLVALVRDGSAGARSLRDQGLVKRSLLPVVSCDSVRSASSTFL